MNSIRSVVPALVAGVCAAAASAQVAYTNGTYVESFNTLSNASSSSWSNNGTLPGWYSFAVNTGGANAIRDAMTNPVIVINGGTGSGTTGGLWSYGAAASTERALGSLGSNSFESVILLVIQNNNNYALTDFTLSYDGEQWRNGGNTATQALIFDYTVLSALPTAADASAANTAGYTTVLGLNFNSPVATSTAAPVDGNTTGRVANISANVTGLTVPAGGFLVLRWWDNNDINSDHGLAIDNLSFSATPTPGTAALFGIGLIASARRRRA